MNDGAQDHEEGGEDMEELLKGTKKSASSGAAEDDEPPGGQTFKGLPPGLVRMLLISVGGKGGWILTTSSFFRRDFAFALDRPRSS